MGQGQGSGVRGQGQGQGGPGQGSGSRSEAKVRVKVRGQGSGLVTHKKFSGFAGARVEVRCGWHSFKLVQHRVHLEHMSPSSFFEKDISGVVPCS